MELLRIPIRDGTLNVEVAPPPAASTTGATAGRRVHRATLTIDSGVVRVVEPRLYVVDDDLDELVACLDALAAGREGSWLATSGRSPYLVFSRTAQDADGWEVVFHDEPASGARVSVYTRLDWVDECRELVRAVRATLG